MNYAKGTIFHSDPPAPNNSLLSPLLASFQVCLLYAHDDRLEAFSLSFLCILKCRFGHMPIPWCQIQKDYKSDTREGYILT